MLTLDDSWPGRRQRYTKLRAELRTLTRSDRRIDAELARLLTAAKVVEWEGELTFADHSPIPPFTSSEREAAILWFQCLHDEAIPAGGPLVICRRLVEEAAEIFE